MESECCSYNNRIYDSTMNHPFSLESVSEAMYFNYRPPPSREKEISLMSF